MPFYAIKAHPVLYFGSLTGKLNSPGMLGDRLRILPVWEQKNLIKQAGLRNVNRNFRALIQIWLLPLTISDVIVQNMCQNTCNTQMESNSATVSEMLTLQKCRQQYIRTCLWPCFLPVLLPSALACSPPAHRGADLKQPDSLFRLCHLTQWHLRVSVFMKGALLWET